MKYKIMSRLSLTLCSSISTPKTNNKKGEDYEPESLKVMMASLDRHLRNKGCTMSIVRDREFSSSNEVLEDKHGHSKSTFGKYLFGRRFEI